MDIGALRVKNFTSTVSLNKTEPLFYTAPEKLPRGRKFEETRKTWREGEEERRERRLGGERRLGRRLGEREKRRGERAD